jgi:predicted nucleic acid-binding protein
MVVLVDTNIVLDVVQRRVPHERWAAQVWGRVERGEITGYVSAISFNNIYYVLRKPLGVDGAMDAVRTVRRTFRTVPVDEALIDRAIALAMTDFEDAIQRRRASECGRITWLLGTFRTFVRAPCLR